MNRQEPARRSEKVRSIPSKGVTGGERDYRSARLPTPEEDHVISTPIISRGNHRPSGGHLADLTGDPEEALFTVCNCLVDLYLLTRSLFGNHKEGRDLFTVDVPEDEQEQQNFVVDPLALIESMSHVVEWLSLVKDVQGPHTGVYEEMLQRAENSIRKRVRLEQQLKLIIESTQQKLEETERSKAELHEKLKRSEMMIVSLHADLDNLHKKLESKGAQLSQHRPSKRPATSREKEHKRVESEPLVSSILARLQRLDRQIGPAVPRLHTTDNEPPSLSSRIGQKLQEFSPYRTSNASRGTKSRYFIPKSNGVEQKRQQRVNLTARGNQSSSRMSDDRSSLLLGRSSSGKKPKPWMARLAETVQKQKLLEEISRDGLRGGGPKMPLNALAKHVGHLMVNPLQKSMTSSQLMRSSRLHLSLIHI
eukprot:TRINITY_DN10788_c0_g1_i2.p1 TRINITY_DN10788_c0_g1~~TRINITY_DN10788_c0_g1_i2.p1  ORF type:complete len:421 (-),score=68.18 TRINITY_DN10788_c0_g1_i2:60-1322(-)